jgi:outer membrane protein assembly factor BamD (BamD/ComL family)
LRGAQRALDSGSPTQALTLLNQYATEFPRGALRHESQAARIIALCAAGQRSAGLRAAEQFLQAEPSSPFARRVRTACGAPDSATGSSGQE